MKTKNFSGLQSLQALFSQFRRNVNFAAFSPGSAVREAEALITLIPLDGNIELEAELSPQDIGKIDTGAAARIKLTAYPFQKHGTLDGIVRNISENTLQKEGSGQEVTYCRARLSVSGQLEKLNRHSV